MWFCFSCSFRLTCTRAKAKSQPETEILLNLKRSNGTRSTNFHESTRFRCTNATKLLMHNVFFAEFHTETSKFTMEIRKKPIELCGARKNQQMTKKTIMLQINDFLFHKCLWLCFHFSLMLYYFVTAKTKYCLVCRLTNESPNGIHIYI